jgi:SAM-dependent methyltransferase
METQHYHDMYELEDAHWWHVRKRAICLDLLRRWAPAPHPDILDLGCGTGKNVEAFGALGTVWGVDSAAEAVRFCAARGLTRVRQEPAEATGFPDAAFDAVTLLDVLEHTDAGAVLREAHRLLRPGGVVVVTVPAYRWMWSRWDEAVHHRRRYGRAELRRALEAGGFRVLKLSHLHALLVAPVWLVRRIKSRRFPAAGYPSDFRLSPPLVNRTLLALSGVEARLMHRVSIPFGLSLVAAARKED